MLQIFAAHTADTMDSIQRLRERQDALAREVRRTREKLVRLRDRLDEIAGAIDRIAAHRTKAATMTMMASGLPQENLFDRDRRR